MNKLLLLLISTFMLAACQPGKEVIREVPGTAPQGDSPGGGTDPLQSGGVVDSGGGNGLRGRPLESYNVDMRARPEYQAKVLPILRELAKNHARLASDLLHIARERRWYLIPGDLRLIPSERIGVHFGTEQLALQNLGEIWMNEKAYQAMPGDDDRAILLLHELLMGVLLMRYQDVLDECLSSVAVYEVVEKPELPYRRLRSECHSRNIGVTRTDPRGLGRRISLGEDDYLNLRDLTSRLWESKGDVDGAEMHAWLKIRKFRSYPEN